MEERSDRKGQIASLLTQLRHQGIRDERVLAALAQVPRERFISPEQRPDAWVNAALPIGAGQTISQPYIVALMTEAAAIRPTDRVLEVGTGSGYHTAILAELAGTVVSVERVASLASHAVTTLSELGYQNVSIHVGDGTTGWPDLAPFDAILVTAAGPQVPLPLLNQLNPDGGRLVIPVGEPHDQNLFLIERHGSETRDRSLGAVRFVPLIGRAGWAAQVEENGFLV